MGPVRDRPHPQLEVKPPVVIRPLRVPPSKQCTVVLEVNGDFVDFLVG
jgi:hypothetical protein